MKKHLVTLLTTTLICSSILFGCKQETSETTVTIEEILSETTSSETTPETESSSHEIEETELPQSSTEVKSTEDTPGGAEESTAPITITIINDCGADIGMFSVIDPVTKEQVNVDGIINGDSLSIQANWPIGITDFQWAIYNKYGELYTESTTNISQAKESVVITLQGNGSIDNINTSFQ